MATILAIDDNALVLTGMAMLLEAWGYDVIAATSSQEAIARLAGAKAPDFIISDYRLSDGSTGLDAVNDVTRLVGYAVPAMIVTGENVLDEILVSGLPVMRKPISPDGLRNCLVQAIGGAA